MLLIFFCLWSAQCAKILSKKIIFESNLLYFSIPTFFSFNSIGIGISLLWTLVFGLFMLSVSSIWNFSPRKHRPLYHIILISFIPFVYNIILFYVVWILVDFFSFSLDICLLWLSRAVERECTLGSCGIEKDICI